MQLVFYHLTLKQNTFKKIFLCLSERGKRVVNQRVPQVLDISTRFTSKFKWEHNPEPCRAGSTWPSPPYLLTFTQGSCTAGKRHQQELDVLEWESKDQDFLPKSLLSHSVPKVIIWPYLLPTSAKCEHFKRKRALEPSRRKECLMLRLQNPKGRVTVGSHSLN